ncbi:MauE/DoxX family redox-associated membrane protein [Chloroflexota bacterium]
MRYKHWASIGAAIILGLIFVASGLGKLLSQAESFKTIFNPFPDFLGPTFTGAVFSWLPFIELIVGLLLIIGVSAKLMAVFSLALTVGFITNNSWLISRELGYEPCDCFGIMERIIQVELSTAGALYLDIGMLALVLIILFCHPGKFLTLRPWFLR